MYKTIEKKIFCAIFLAGSFLPVLFLNHDPEAISVTENRPLAARAEMYNEDGTMNEDYTRDFEDWFKDRVGFRSELAELDAVIQYRVFRQIKDMPLGVHGELAPYKYLEDYQHKDLYSPEELRTVTDAYQTVFKYLKSSGIQMYYMQCRDKHTICPEQYPDTIRVFGEESLVDQVTGALTADTDVPVIETKETLLKAKNACTICTAWSDPWHWTPRGAFLGYQDLIRTINAANDGRYRELTEADYAITVEDKGKTYYNAVHEPEMLEVFEVRDKKYRAMPEKLTYKPEDIFTPHMKYYVNNSVDNGDTLLILGDSYIHDSHILSALASTFHTTVMYNGEAINDRHLIHILEEYDPDIVLFENAERSSALRYSLLLSALEDMRNRQYEPGTPIRFAKEGGNAETYCINGLAQPDDHFTWTLGEKSTFVLAMKNVGPGTPLSLSLHTAGVHLDSQPVTVRINGEAVWQGTVSGEETIHADFAMPNTEFLRVRLEISDPVSPFEAGESNDTRKIGLALADMTVSVR